MEKFIKQLILLKNYVNFILKNLIKSKKNTELNDVFNSALIGCAGRTRTSGLWVMSPTSCQLLPPRDITALCRQHIHNTIKTLTCQYFFKK